MELNIGPLSLRYYSGNGWSHAEAAFVSNRNGGMARRETAINAGFKSEHLTEALGKQNPADTFTDPTTGETYYGKIVNGPAGVFTISAKEVYTKALYSKAVKNGLMAAETATTTVEVQPQGTNGVTAAAIAA